jgi:predicted adenylyl cyclase CyaB
MRNVEIKARVPSLEDIHRIARDLSGGSPELIQQEDVFFNCDQGRLKLRIFPDGEGQLIYYRREDAPGPKSSDYDIAPVRTAYLLREVLSLAYGVRGVVRKKRWLYWVGKTRLHLDKVEGLGTFVELEVVMDPGEETERGDEIARQLLDVLKVRSEDLVPCAYIDLIEGQK